MSSAVQSKAEVQGIACVVGGMVALSLQDMVIKWISGSYPLHEIILARATIAVVLTLGMVHMEGGFALLGTRRPVLHLMRGCLLVVANVAYFLALASMPLAEAMAIFFVAPLLITALSVPFLGETVGPWRWFAVLAGLVGVAVMLRPGADGVAFVAVLPIVAAMSYAVMQIITRRLGQTDKASVMAFYVQFSFIVVSGAMGLAVGDGRFAGSGDASLEFLLRAWSVPSGVDAMLIAVCGILIAIAAYLLSQAYRIANAAVLTPFEYTALPLALLWGFLVWGDRPDATSLLGIGLIVGGGIFVFYRETIHGRLVAARRPLPRDR